MRFTYVLFCLLWAAVAFAQDKLPDFGKIDKQELQMTTCSYDPDAEAEWLMDIGEVQYNLTTNEVYIQTDHRCRIKIFNEKGIGEANVKIYYQSKDRYEELSHIEGYVYNLDDAGNMVTTKLEKGQIFDKKVDDRFSQVSFAMPGVKAGSVIEYRYRSHKKSIEDIDDWYFQKEVPVRYSAYNLLIPEYFDFNYKVIRRQDMEIIKTNDAKGNWFIMRNIPGLKEEPYSAGIKDYNQRIDFQLSAIRPPGGETISFRTTWEKLNEELLSAEWFGGQLGKNLPGMDDLKALVKRTTDENEKVRLIYNYVQRNMDWNGRHTFSSSEGIKTAWDKKSGSTGDINLLLVNLLKDAGLKAAPLLASTKDNGRVNAFYPFLYQFNEVVACVQTSSNKVYILNAADKFNPYTLVPYDLQETQGLLIDKKAHSFVTLSDNTQLRHSVSVQLIIDETGNIKGEALANSFGYGKNERLNIYRKGGLKTLFTTADGISIIPDSISVKGADNDSLPLEQHLWLSGALQPNGEYSFVPYHLFTGLRKNPFTAGNRQTDIDFNFQQQYTILGSILLPDTYTIDDLPRNIRMIMPDTSISLTRILQKDANTLSYRMTLVFKRPIYEADEYPDVKEFFKKLYAALDEKIVLKKKS